ncbi:interleukin-17 receptor B isoform X2 [Centropristis striata]|uniref:interleukin-17 receptor B isoform X2 n=1 Tax=Centropristis striata TaxID=184440 RepID=UPI0027E1B8D0|nr:interleukin-17 receptor B isoform X2 [Centropristis striata]
MMWGATLFLFFYVVAQASSHDIKMECHEYHDSPPVSESSPSVLADLRVERVEVGGKYMIDINWNVSMDGSIHSLTGTRIVITGLSTYHCKYNPVLAEAKINEPLIEFHHRVKATNGRYVVQVSNLPLPPMGSDSTYKYEQIRIPRERVPTMQTSSTATVTASPVFKIAPTKSSEKFNFTTVAVAVFGGLAGLMFLASCYIIYKRCGANFATSLGFKKLPTSTTAAVPVLVVYPAENSAFQRAVVALAEFLQWHGGCSVAVDMWQQGKIAELGPMRWLAEQTEAAHRVLIVCPQPSSQPGHSPPNHPEAYIPAAAHDLYPLVLNMVASHAKSASNLAKFCVVQLGKQRDKKSSDLVPELRACKNFCLMKDLNKLYKSLHTQSQDDKKLSNQIFGPQIAYSEKNAVKLMEAVEKLGGHQASICREKEPLKSVVAVV